MLKKSTTPVQQKKQTKKNIDFFDLPVNEQEKMITKAAKLSTKDQQALLKKYEQKFGKLQTSNCK
jgi:hypothetical protein